MRAGLLAAVLVCVATPFASTSMAQRADIVWARQAPGAIITLDGVLDEPAWAGAESAERQLASLQGKVDQLSCQQALLLGKLVGINHAPGYGEIAQNLARDLEAASATVEVTEVDRLSENSARFGTLYYRNGALATKARATRQLLLPRYPLALKQGNWAISSADLVVWVGPKKNAG